MSVTSPGPGWWLASDGRWYGPDEQTGVQPRAPQFESWQMPQEAEQPEGGSPSDRSPGHPAPNPRPPVPRQSARRLWLVGTLSLVVGILIGVGGTFGLKAIGPEPPTPPSQTFTVTVDTASWAKVQAFVAGPKNGGLYASGAELIWSFLCENPADGPWTSPVPTQIGDSPEGPVFRVHLTGNQVAQAQKWLEKESCNAKYGIKTIEGDYRWAAEPAQIDSSLSAASSP